MVSCKSIYYFPFLLLLFLILVSTMISTFLVMFVADLPFLLTGNRCDILDAAATTWNYRNRLSLPSRLKRVRVYLSSCLKPPREEGEVKPIVLFGNLSGEPVYY